MPVATTPRLAIRRFRLEDAGFILRLLNEPTFIENIADKGVATREQAEAYLRDGPLASYRDHGHGLYLVAEKGTLEPMGMCGLVRRDYLDAPDLGYAFLPEYVGRGCAFEACTAVLDHGRRDLGLDRFLAIVNPGNRRSISLLHRLGFVHRGLVRAPGGKEDLVLFELGRDPAEHFEGS